MLRTLGFLLCLAVCFAGVARRSTGEEGEEGPALRTIDLSAYAASEAPKGPRLSVPADLIELVETPHSVEIWSVEAFESATWAPFEQPALAGHAVSADRVAALLRAALPPTDPQREEVGLVVGGTGIAVRASPAQWASLQSVVPWVLESLAPSLRVDAVLAAEGADGLRRLRALGRARLWPNRWTRIYLQENAVPCVVHWDIEVAQESTTMDPFTIPVPEGQELYLRYHPGESVSVVEAWAGSVEHLEIVERDLSEIRNIPEANGPGTLSFPRSAVHRLYTAYVLPAGEAAQRETTWRSETGTEVLQLSFEGPSGPHRPLDRAPRAALLALRVGAVGNALEYDARLRSTDVWEDRLEERLHRGGPTAAERAHDARAGVSTLGDPSLLLLEAPLARMEELRALLVDAEHGLEERTILLETRRVPEGAFRKAVDEGSVRVGRPLPADVESAWRKAGAVTVEGLTAQALVGIAAGFRIGHSIPGITDFEAELAQSSAGLRPDTSARFAGLRGEVRLRVAEGAVDLEVLGALEWASSEAGWIDLVYRSPVSMKGLAEGTRTNEGTARRVRMPVLGGGSAPIDARIPLGSAGDATRLHLVQAAIRGDDVLLLLAAVR